MITRQKSLKTCNQITIEFGAGTKTCWCPESISSLPFDPRGSDNLDYHVTKLSMDIIIRLNKISSLALSTWTHCTFHSGETRDEL